MHIKIIIALLVGLFVLADSQYSRSKSEYLTCHTLVGRRNGACIGKHCYKMSTEIDGQKIIKKGCLNATDIPSSLGTCTSKPSETTFEETWCLCNDRNKCNFSSQKSLSIGAFLAATVYYLL